MIMSLKYMYITNNPRIASLIDRVGVDFVWVDLETLGKEERQAKMDCVKSKHTIQDVEIIKKVLTKSKLLVRINPINPNSSKEIEQVIANGADIIMLPMFKTIHEVYKFLEYISGRVETMLLVETKEAVETLDEILFLEGIDSVHIGLNDLHLSYKKQFMFELLTDGTVDKICEIIRHHGIPYGFGGVARLGMGIIPAEFILSEHYRLGSSQVILSRSFCKPENFISYNLFIDEFQIELEKLKSYEKKIGTTKKHFLEENRYKVWNAVHEYLRAL